eukprot:GILI01023820.1.p1 GENE.GILI01023820.1~~GILI01023820.1.p1  ORF type:complete len:340 (+),score=73.33 GILI01023820.1:164-1183(+)
MTVSLPFVIAAIIAMLSVPVLGQTSGKEVVAYFASTGNFASVEVLTKGYTKCMGWSSVPQATCQQSACTTAENCALKVACVIADNTQMTQLIDFVANNESTFIECVLDNYPSTIASSIRVVNIPDTTNAPPAEDDKSFIAKYPYVIAAIAVAVLIAIIVASVLLIQKRANHLAEMDDEAMLSEHEAPGWNSHNSNRRNDLPPSGRGNGAADAAGGSAARKPSQNPGGKQRQKSAGDADDNPFDGSKNINNNSGNNGNNRPVSNSQKGGGYQAPTVTTPESSSPADQAATEAPKQSSASPTADASPAVESNNDASSAAPETAVVNVNTAASEGEEQAERE